MKLIPLIHNIYVKSKNSTRTFPVDSHSFLSGLIGFFSFLSIIIVAKYFNYIVGSDKIITIDILDIFLAIIGFGLVYIFKSLEKRSNGDNKN